jgi:hypothetical protein
MMAQQAGSGWAGGMSWRLMKQNESRVDNPLANTFPDHLHGIHLWIHV